MQAFFEERFLQKLQTKVLMEDHESSWPAQ